MVATSSEDIEIIVDDVNDYFHLLHSTIKHATVMLAVIQSN
jgi:hypothetical protein